MKLGFGFYSHMLTPRDYRFAVQSGATHAVVHLVDYTYGGPQEAGNEKDNQPIGGGDGWGVAGRNLHLWDEEALRQMVSEMAEQGLTVQAIENFDPADWYDVLLGGPKRDEQIETIQRRIRAVGRAGIPAIGYNFSITGVSSRVSRPFARGNAESVGMTQADERPVPKGMVWNMWYDQSLADTGFQPSASEEELWSRWEYFMDAVLPVAEKEGVTLAAHPDDPPIPTARQQPKFVWKPEQYQRLLDYASSPANKLEFCLGTLAEMPGHDIYQTVANYAKQKAISYVHFRNISGTAPNYQEKFIDEGSVDMRHIIAILKESEFDGVLIPDHTPLMSCEAPWHAGMAFAMGYMQALLQEDI